MRSVKRDPLNIQRLGTSTPFKKKKPYVKRSMAEFSINPGLSSILLIFVTLCLVCFAILTYVSAFSDKKLNDKVMDRTQDYYIACNKAYEIIADVDKELSEAYLSAENEEAYYESVFEERSFTVAVNDSQELHVGLKILYPTKGDEGFYTISRWEVVTVTSNAVIIED